jgi:hypothetical protein
MQHDVPAEPHLSQFYCGIKKCNNGKQFLCIEGKELVNQSVLPSKRDDFLPTKVTQSPVMQSTIHKVPQCDTEPRHYMNVDGFENSNSQIVDGGNENSNLSSECMRSKGDTFGDLQRISQSSEKDRVIDTLIIQIMFHY